MKIVAWNYNMEFHNKYESLLALGPDIAIVPECANIELLKNSSPDFKPTSTIWIVTIHERDLLFSPSSVPWRISGLFQELQM
jgi:hypothetical protein